MKCKKEPLQYWDTLRDIHTAAVLPHLVLNGDLLLFLKVRLFPIIIQNRNIGHGKHGLLTSHLALLGFNHLFNHISPYGTVLGRS